MCYNVPTMTLYDALTQYSASDAYPFHMPGHKRRAARMCDPSLIDITEIDGFDNLHHAEGILQQAQERAAALYHSSETHFLVNGSTAGILCAIGACVRPGDTLLMARNSHRSAYNAAALNRVKTLYLYPQVYSGNGSRTDTSQSGLTYIRHGGQTDTGNCAPADTVRNLSGSSDLNGPVDPSQVEKILSDHPGIRAVFITSPTYDGVVSDVNLIAQIAHRHNAALIVDEAHGAHFGMHPIFPESSVTSGADLVIHSLHKTLPALTQTALIHVNSSLVDRRRLRRLLGVYQTSSPSYVLMASIDRCVSLLSVRGKELFDAYANRLERFYADTKPEHIQFLTTDDPSRILIRPEGMSAVELYDTLRDRFRLQPEMVTQSYVLMLSSVCDDEEGFSRLSSALLQLDKELADKIRSGGSCVQSGKPEKTYAQPGLSENVDAQPGLSENVDAQSGHSENVYMQSRHSETVCTIAEALDAETKAIAFSGSAGQISGEFLTLYPPGVPLLVPGERIPADMIRQVLDLKKKGYSLQGTDDHSLETIRVL